eukprot:TRINITY_DN47710_c0_g1_i3.p2 TRINITY_DN47710_c0_g1~~TRINITY_DN47710_c0_g1_i3.p2  ORF type:complete len:121 (+),score=2.52 TRINITY_DN47710_c0_g1_i3:517-879(+)
MCMKTDTTGCGWVVLLLCRCDRFQLRATPSPYRCRRSSRWTSGLTTTAKGSKTPTLTTTIKLYNEPAQGMGPDPSKTAIEAACDPLLARDGVLSSHLSIHCAMMIVVAVLLARTVSLRSV